RSTEQAVAIGDLPAAAKPTSHAKVRPGQHTEALDQLQDRLTNKLDTRVKVTLGKAKGRIVIEFASVQDLERIVGLISPDDPGLGLN
ncbi:MAG: chromosome partitioning protein ParB, partial [Micrococcales bacterium]|nr:chromosome partitioning protein ParB [Micrococcales bacterium]